MMQDKLKQNKGQLLVEMMVAMGVLMVGLLGIFAVLSQALALNRIAANQYIASNLAAEGVEVVKNILDANAINGTVAWNEGLTTDGDFGVQYDSTVLDAGTAGDKLHFNQTNGRYSYSSTGPETNFIRIISIENISGDEIKVTSRVEWVDRGGLRLDIEVEDRFLNWRAEI